MVQLTKGTPVSYPLPPHIFTMQLLSLKPQNISGFPNNKFSYLFWLLPGYNCTPSPGSNAKLTAPDGSGTSTDPQAHGGMRKVLLIKHKNGAWLTAQVPNLCPYEIAQNTQFQGKVHAPFTREVISYVFLKGVVSGSRAASQSIFLCT